MASVAIAIQRMHHIRTNTSTEYTLKVCIHVKHLMILIYVQTHRFEQIIEMQLFVCFEYISVTINMIVPLQFNSIMCV